MRGLLVSALGESHRLRADNGRDGGGEGIPLSVDVCASAECCPGDSPWGEAVTTYDGARLIPEPPGGAIGAGLISVDGDEVWAGCGLKLSIAAAFMLPESL